ncbi:hypothetical protein PR048_010026 [Dryococelus australis]|uniref:Uncharacterized protein n=1 Tax=Dryococelus australis TaxID=614101 RepID=A0ABQ9I1M7_9NEOP|nr:hypothetical protein PR048_010026 [Dryococelus australis]
MNEHFTTVCPNHVQFSQKGVASHLCSSQWTNDTSSCADSAVKLSLGQQQSLDKVIDCSTSVGYRSEEVDGIPEVYGDTTVGDSSKEYDGAVDIMTEEVNGDTTVRDPFEKVAYAVGAMPEEVDCGTAGSDPSEEVAGTLSIMLEEVYGSTALTNRVQALDHHVQESVGRSQSFHQSFALLTILHRTHCNDESALSRWGRGGLVDRLLTFHLSEPGSITSGDTPGFSHVRILPNDAAGRRVFSWISRFPSTCIPTLLHTHLTSPLSALKNSINVTVTLAVAVCVLGRLRYHSTTYLRLQAHPKSLTVIYFPQAPYDGEASPYFKHKTSVAPLRGLCNIALFLHSPISPLPFHQHSGLRRIFARNRETVAFSPYSTLLSKLLRAGEGEIGENGVAPECKSEGNGRYPTKPADQRHHPSRSPLLEIRGWPGQGLSPVRLGGTRTFSVLSHRDSETKIMAFALNISKGAKIAISVKRFEQSCTEGRGETSSSAIPQVYLKVRVSKAVRKATKGAQLYQHERQHERTRLLLKWALRMLYHVPPVVCASTRLRSAFDAVELCRRISSQETEDACACAFNNDGGSSEFNTLVLFGWLPPASGAPSVRAKYEVLLLDGARWLRAAILLPCIRSSPTLFEYLSPAVAITCRAGCQGRAAPSVSAQPCNPGWWRHQHAPHPLRLRKTHAPSREKSWGQMMWGKVSVRLGQHCSMVASRLKVLLIIRSLNDGLRVSFRLKQHISPKRVVYLSRGTMVAAWRLSRQLQSLAMTTGPHGMAVLLLVAIRQGLRWGWIKMAEIRHCPLLRDKSDSDTPIKCFISTKHRALNLRVVYSSWCVYLWDFQRWLYHFTAANTQTELHLPLTSYVSAGSVSVRREWPLAVAEHRCGAPTTEPSGSAGTGPLWSAFRKGGGGGFDKGRSALDLAPPTSTKLPHNRICVETVPWRMDEGGGGWSHRVNQQI